MEKKGGERGRELRDYKDGGGKASLLFNFLQTNERVLLLRFLRFHRFSD